MIAYLSTRPPYLIAYFACAVPVLIAAREIWRDYRWKSLAPKRHRGDRW